MLVSFAVLHPKRCAMHALSRTTIVVHSRDDKEVGIAHEVKSSKNQPQFSQMMMGQYWLDPNKPSDQPEMLSKSCQKFF